MTFVKIISRATKMTEEQAHEAMLQFVSERCCYGKTPAQEMIIRDITPSDAYHVSFTMMMKSQPS